MEPELTSQLNPLGNYPIVDQNGTPTAAFRRWARTLEDRSGGSGEALTNDDLVIAAGAPVALFETAVDGSPVSVLSEPIVDGDPV